MATEAAKTNINKSTKKRGRPAEYDYICPKDPTHSAVKNTPKPYCKKCSTDVQKVFMTKKCKHCSVILDRNTIEHAPKCPLNVKAKTEIRIAKDEYSQSKYGVGSIRKKPETTSVPSIQVQSVNSSLYVHQVPYMLVPQQALIQPYPLQQIVYTMPQPPPPQKILTPKAVKLNALEVEIFPNSNRKPSGLGKLFELVSQRNDGISGITKKKEKKIQDSIVRNMKIFSENSAFKSLSKHAV